MKRKLKVNNGRRTILENFWKPITSDDDACRASDEEAVSSNSSLNDPTYCPEKEQSCTLYRRRKSQFRRHSHGTTPKSLHSRRQCSVATSKSLHSRKHLSVASSKSFQSRRLSRGSSPFFKRILKGGGISGTVNEHCGRNDIRSQESENLKNNKKNKARNGESNNFLNDLPLVAKSPPIGTEASMPVTGITLGNEETFDYSIDSSSINLKSNDSSDKETFKRGVSKEKKSKRIGTSRKKRGPKEFSNTDLSYDFVLPRIHTITIGNFVLEPLYMSPLPLELVKKGHIYICEKCLDFKECKKTLERHLSKCYINHPPGNEIFRQDSVSVFEIDGNISKAYSQNLCLLAKLFIDHKTLFYDVEPFLFYVLTVHDLTGLHVAGYFSKQKFSSENNLSCILTLPSYQNRGYGRFLIDFSFLLSRREGITGTPEKPLSDLGILAYRSYWRSTVLEYFKRPSSRNHVVLSIEDIAKTTGISVEDIMNTMIELGMLHFDHKGELKSLIINDDLIELHWSKASKDVRRIWIDEDNLKVDHTFLSLKITCME
ncbi:unnamed protein product [Thelazia callipaeda]|uniref:histone acetyltransferase n=1 Tax=Thelazia callipaeda TaxID=103827 RepID=A0A0N5DAL6_THECL|nr:unnamed protein product [Thelazia callipaeda]